jgi:hypothetical protein
MLTAGLDKEVADRKQEERGDLGHAKGPHFLLWEHLHVFSAWRQQPMDENFTREGEGRGIKGEWYPAGLTFPPAHPSSGAGGFYSLRWLT